MASPDSTTTAASPTTAAHADEDRHSEASSSVPSTLMGRCVSQMDNRDGSRLSAVRRLHQAVDADLQFLQNRLAKLRLEEEKAKTDILELRKKTEDVSQAQMKHAQTSTMRKALSVQVDYGRRKEAALIALNKERQAKAVWASKQRVLVERKEAVANLRKQKEINECRVKILEEEKREKAIRQRESIREMRSMAKSKRDEADAQRREEARRLHETKLEQIAREREEKEQLAAELIAQEAQMIYRLKLLHEEKQRQLQQLAAIVEFGPNAATPTQEDTAVGGAAASS